MRLAPLLLLALTPAALSQQAVTIGADRDNTIYSHPAGSLSNGAGTRMFVGRTGNGRLTRGIVHFDVASSIPVGSRVTAVRFDGRIALSSNGATGPDDHGLHLVLADWGEGTTIASMGQGGGGASTTGSVTHLHTFFPGTFWQNPGGDFEAVASATGSAPLTGNVVMDSAMLIDDVQGWLDSAGTNFGWILKAVDESSGAHVYDTREGGGLTTGPRITVTFEPPIGSSICGPAVVNASGFPGEIHATGSVVVNDNLVTVSATNVTPNSFGFFLVSDTSGFAMNPGGSFGNICLGGAIGRYQNAVQNSGPEGMLSLGIDLTAIARPTGPVAASPGDTYFFQAWFRDVQGGVVGSNFTEAVQIDLQ